MPIHEYNGITTFDKVVNQILVYIKNGFSGFNRLNLAGIDEEDNRLFYNNCFLIPLFILF